MVDVTKWIRIEKAEIVEMIERKHNVKIKTATMSAKGFRAEIE